MEKLDAKTRVIRSILGGMVIGFICGFVGAGGGMMMLLLEFPYFYPHPLDFSNILVNNFQKMPKYKESFPSL